MIDKQLPDEFWIDNISRDDGKHNLSQEVWERICKVRNSPIRLVRDKIIGEPHKPHTVIPEGYRGYLIDFPEAFYLSDEDQQRIAAHSRFNHWDPIPASICGYEGIVFLHDGDYEIVPPFFDLMLASSPDLNIIND